MIRLPETFHLPTGEDYDDIIGGIDDDINEEGGPGHYLGMIREARVNWLSFNYSMLHPGAQHALLLETRDEDNKLLDKSHSMANTIMSGMIFGHMVNESTYPKFMLGGAATYHPILIDPSLLGSHQPAFEQAGGHETLKGLRVGYRRMSAYCLEQLSEKSLATVDSWSDKITDVATLRPYFTYGFGIALYAGLDRYAGLLNQQGRNKEVSSYEQEATTHVDRH